MLPWILGRSLGVACYLTMTALVAVGIWLRHPWRYRFPRPGPETLLRSHVALAAATMALLAGHMTSLALDHYAGVGWVGTFVPWHAQYRPTAVALGTFAFYGMVLVAGTAALAGTIARRVWFPVHTVSAGIFALCAVHGVLAGSDSASLRWLYVATGALVVAVQITRWTARYTGRPSELEPA
jgi:sulfoxide reductase heme-binding subunit YedZ